MTYKPFTLAFMFLQDIYIYPIKSLGGYRTSEAQVEIRGFQFDRRWMLVDQNGQFLSQRSFHTLSLLQVKKEQKGFTVSHKQNPKLSHWFPIKPETTDYSPVTIWDDTLMGQRVNLASDEWFSQILDSTCSLVHMPLTSPRYIGEKYAVNNETVSFADSMPYMVIGQESLEDLNSKLAEP